MKLLIRAAVALAAVACVAATFVQSKDPEAILKSINDHRTKAFAAAREAGIQIDIAALNAEIAKMANDAIAGVEVGQVEPSKAYAWAQVFSLAGKHKETCDLCMKFVASGPEPEAKFDAQMLMLTSCNNLGEGEMLATMLPDVSAPSLFASQSLFRSVVNYYADTISEDMGLEAALKSIDRAFAQVQFESPEDYAKRLLPSYRERNLKNRDGSPMTDEQLTSQLLASGKSVNDGLRYAAADKKASLLMGAGRKDEGLKVLMDFVTSVDASSAYARRANSAIKQAELIGSPAVKLNYDRKYGEFNGLDQWLGKVVIIDFTAHW